MKNQLANFEDYKIRRVYDEKAETWYFSVVDIIQALLQQHDFQAARNYWKVLKNRLKLEAADGKKYLTDVASPETLLRLIAEVTQATGMRRTRWRARRGAGLRARRGGSWRVRPARVL